MTMLLMPVSMRFAEAVGAVDHPDARKVHAHSMPRLGGLAIAVSVIATCFMFLEIDRLVAGLVAGCGVIALVGMADDIFHLRPWQKFIGEFLAATIFVMVSGASLRTLGDLLGTGPLMTGSFAVPLTVFAIVGVINALNLSDGLDGLAGGLGLIACMFLGYFAFTSQHWDCLAIVLVLFGAVLGFLYFNTYPAKTFMGDVGSLTLGYLLATVSVLLAESDKGRSIAPISMALILALPIVDTLTVMGRRMYLGYSPFSPDKTHLHHRLLNLGLPHAAVVPFMYSLMALFGFAAIFMEGRPEWLQLTVGLMMATAIYTTVAILAKKGYRWQDRGEIKKLEMYEGQVRHWLTAWIGKSVPLVSILIPVVLLIPAFALSSLPDGIALGALFVGLLVLVMYPWTASSDRHGLAHGLIYLGIFVILSVYNLYGPSWVGWYTACAVGMMTVWVALKLVFKNHGQVFLTSGIEVLAIIISWFVPVALANAFSVSEDVRQSLMAACLEAIPLLLAAKIVIRRQLRRNRPLAASLIVILLFVYLRSGLGVLP